MTHDEIAGAVQEAGDITIEEAQAAIHQPFCAHHLGLMVREVKRRHLWDFVPKNPDEAERRMTFSYANGVDSAATFDPLMEVLLGIYHSTLTNSPNGIPDGCILCALREQHGSRAVMSWIRQAGRDAMFHAVNLRLVPVWRTVWFLFTGAR